MSPPWRREASGQIWPERTIPSAHEVIEFQRCLAEGLLDSPLVPHAQTLTIMRQMDRLRERVGERYPDDA